MPSASEFPRLVFVDATESRELAIEHWPFTIGRRADRNLVIHGPHVSREHAAIVLEHGSVYLVDAGSRHGTFVNGLKVLRQRLKPGDRIEFGARGSAHLDFDPPQTGTNINRALLSQLSSMSSRPEASEFEKLSLYLDIARSLDRAGVLDDILAVMLDATLKLTGAERGLVYLRTPDGTLRLAAGRNAKGQPVTDDDTVSRSIIAEAAQTAGEFLITDTQQASAVAARQSILAHDLRTILCIPLRENAVRETRASLTPEAALPLGVLYLDSHSVSHPLSQVSHDILRALARDAAALVNNARLVHAEEAARRMRQELDIAADIQQRLMSATLPEVGYASVTGRNLACLAVGGDFFDVVGTPSGLAVVLADVSGKGISAALLAQVLQGMIYTQLLAGTDLATIAAVANRYLFDRTQGEKYATLVLLRITPQGEVEFANCGHVPPLLCSAGTVTRIEPANLPVGLLPMASYTGSRIAMQSGDRLLLVSDGVTEAENNDGEMFGDDRLQAAFCHGGADAVLQALRQFCGGVTLNDDCTLLDLSFHGPS